jgi:beta-glucanase (GH16 family)
MVAITFIMLRAIALAAAGAALVLAQTPAGTIFSEDFSGQALDRARWNVIVTGRTVNDEQQAYVDAPDTIAVADGSLAITARRRPGFKTPEERAFDFISGRIDTRGKFQFTYGTAEARIKLTAGAGLWPAFWALGNGRWPDGGEMDILENVGDAAWTNFALHGPGYSGGGGFSARQFFTPPEDITGWHVYAMDWSRDALAFSVDGHERWRMTRAAVEAKGPWAYDSPKFLIVNLALGGQYPHAVNHAETPYLGLPQSTVDVIAAGKAVMLVDWIHVTGR